MSFHKWFPTPEEITNFTQMGGEGAFWIGRAPFSNREHSFQILEMVPIPIQVILLFALQLPQV